MIALYIVRGISTLIYIDEIYCCSITDFTVNKTWAEPVLLLVNWSWNTTFNQYDLNPPSSFGNIRINEIYNVHFSRFEFSSLCSANWTTSASQRFKFGFVETVHKHLAPSNNDLILGHYNPVSRHLQMWLPHTLSQGSGFEWASMNLNLFSGHFWDDTGRIQVTEQ